MLTVLRHCRQILACAGPAPRRGPAQRDVAVIPDGAVAWDGDTIRYAGPDAQLPPEYVGVPPIDGSRWSVVPGFVDAHTHAIFAGDRREELRCRLAGATYAEIAAAGGGIVSTVRATRDASEADLVAATRPRQVIGLRVGSTSWPTQNAETAARKVRETIVQPGSLG